MVCVGVTVVLVRVAIILFPPRHRAKAALLEATQRAVTDLCLCENSLELEFCGLSSFGKRVVFARLVEGEGYERLRKIAGGGICWER